MAKKKIMKPEQKRLSPVNHCMTLFFILITVWQGGFSNISWCLSGIFLSALLTFRPFVIPPKFVLFALAGLLAAYAVSTVNAGFHAEGWMGAGKIVVVIVWVLLLFGMELDADDLVFKAGLVVAGVGLLAYGGWLTNMTVAGRLFGVFQYANATGIFLAVCAFLTRLSGKKAVWAVMMETALMLTLSVGALAVYAAGWILYCIAGKKMCVGYCLCGMILSAVIAAGMLAVARYTPFPWLSPLIPLAYIVAWKPVQIFIDNLSQKRWVIGGAIALGSASVGGVLLLRGMQPLLTFVERAIQISDGFNTMLLHPLGLGPGAWAFYMQMYKTADYDAAVPHCGYIQIGLSGGFLAVGLVAALIVYWLYRKRMDKYIVAALMILVHALQDFSFSFLAIILLLLLCMYAAENRREPDAYTIFPKRLGALFLLPVIACAVLVIPETVKNRAGWAAAEGRYEDAADILAGGFLLPDDTEASLLRILYAGKAEDYPGVDREFDRMKNPNDRALYWKVVSCMEQGRFTQAARFGLLCAEKAPYRWEVYQLIEEILPRLSAAEREECEERMQAIRDQARRNTHSLSKYLGSAPAELSEDFLYRSH